MIDDLVMGAVMLGLPWDELLGLPASFVDRFLNLLRRGLQ